MSPPSAYSKANPATTVTHRKRNLVMYSLQKHEVDTLSGGYTSPSLGLFGLFAGATLALWLAYAQWNAPEPLATRMLCGIWICGGLAIICAFLAVKEWWKAKKLIETITEETIEYVVERKETMPPLSQ